MPDVADPRSLPPKLTQPQLSLLVEAPPSGPDWAHELKYDGYRIHARLVRGEARLLTRTGLDWTDRYAATANAVSALGVQSAYLDGELCAVRSDGTTSFSEIQAATDERRTTNLVYFVFDLLFLDGEKVAGLPLLERKERLKAILEGGPRSIQYSDHHIGDGQRFLQAACGAKAEGIISKRRGRALCSGRPRALAQSQVLSSGRVHHCRLQRARRFQIAYRRPAARLLRRCGAPCLRRARRHGHVRRRAAPRARSPPTASHPENAARRAAATNQPLRISAQSLARYLGKTQDGLRSAVSDEERGRVS